MYEERVLEWDPKERDAWVSDAQRWIQQIHGVLQCKVDLDPEGEISGVHVVAGMDRDARHIVRDVESLLKARLDIDVYYKKIGVVQVVGNGHAGQTTPFKSAPPADRPTPEAAPRKEPRPSTVTFHPEDDGLDDLELGNLEQEMATARPDAPDVPEAGKSDPAAPPIPAVLVSEEDNLRFVCSGVGVMASDNLVRAEVQLRAGEMQVRGVAEGSNHEGSAISLVARATCQTLLKMVDEPILLHLRDVRKQMIGDQELVLCAIELVEGRRSETLFGCCGLRHNEQQAVVFSVLDALNRRLSLFSLREGEASA